jgi:hypothetical protein
MVPLITPALPGEGQWTIEATGRGGAPAIAVARLRPDVAHRTVTASLAWMDPSAVRFSLIAGTKQPAGHAGASGAEVPPSLRSALRAARQLSDGFGAVPTQAALARFIHADDANHANWLDNNPRFRREKVDSRADLTRPHPSCKMASGVPDRIDQWCQLQRQRLLPGAPAKIFVHRLNDFRLPVNHRCFQQFQRSDPLFVIRRRMAKRSSLPRQQFPQRQPAKGQAADSQEITAANAVAKCACRTVGMQNPQHS